MFEWSTMILRHLQVFYGSLQQNLHHLHLYSSVLRVNRGNTPESWHTGCLFLVGLEFCARNA